MKRRIFNILIFCFIFFNASCSYGVDYIDLADGMIKQGKYEKSRDILTRYLKDSGGAISEQDRQEALFLLGMSEFFIKNFDLAQKYMLSVIDSNKKYYRAQFYLGIMLLAERKDQDALKCFINAKKTIEQLPESENDRFDRRNRDLAVVLSYVMMTSACVGDYELSISTAKIIEQKFPSQRNSIYWASKVIDILGGKSSGQGNKGGDDINVGNEKRVMRSAIKDSIIYYFYIKVPENNSNIKLDLKALLEQWSVTNINCVI